MKIGIEGQRLFRKKKHGMDIVALEMIKNLQRIDTKNEYHIFIKDDEDKNCIQATNNFHLHVLPSQPYPIWEQITLPKAAKKYEVDVLHCTSNTAPLFSPCPTVITLHDIIYLEKNPLGKGSLYQRFGNLYRKFNVPPVIKKAHTVITVSDFERKTIMKSLNLPEEKLKVVYNGVGKHFNSNYSKKQLEEVRTGYQLPEKFILFLGNTAPKKNLVNVVIAFSKYVARNEDSYKLVMVDFSQENLNKVFHQYSISEKVMDRIVLPGYVKNMDLPAFYANASLFIYPSLRESFGIPILESMSCGTPVITSSTSSMPEVAGDAAILIDPYNPDSLADSMENLLKNESLKLELIEKGFKRAEIFTWEKTAEAVLSIYNSIITA